MFVAVRYIAKGSPNGNSYLPCGYFVTHFGANNMATITEIPLKSGTTSYKAVIKQHGKILITKRWSTRKAATAWAKRIESDNEMLEALDSGMATMSFEKLADEYQRWWDGQNRRDKGVPARVKWWKDQLGSMKLIEIRS